MNIFTSVILLAGGTGTRMQSSVPKQFLDLNGKPIALYSFELFMQLSEVDEMIVVCDPSYTDLFKAHKSNIRVKFAEPGMRRQDSVYSGFQQIDPKSHIACIHDSARPFVSLKTIQEVIKAACEIGAATAATPLKFTVKEVDTDKMVLGTPDRSRYWEIQTPQACRSDLLAKGFEAAISRNLTVTDDVSLVELLQHPVKLVESCYTNIKVTTPEDMLFAQLLAKNKFCHA